MRWRQGVIIVGVGLVLGVSLPTVAHPGPWRVSQAGSPVDGELADLERLGEFTVTFRGDPFQCPPEGEPCVYFESILGDKGADGWRDYRFTGVTDEPVTLMTPLGELELPANKMRLYLAPTYAQTFQPEQAKVVPLLVREALLSARAPVTMESYSVQSGRTYHARIEREEYYMPPEPGATKVGVRYNYVLQLSDLPFVKGRPARPLSPRGQLHNY